MLGSANFFKDEDGAVILEKEGNHSPELLFALKVSIRRLPFTFHAIIMDLRKMKMVLFRFCKKTLAGLTYRTIGGQVEISVF